MTSLFRPQSPMAPRATPQSAPPGQYPPRLQPIMDAMSTQAQPVQPSAQDPRSPISYFQPQQPLPGQVAGSYHVMAQKPGMLMHKPDVRPNDTYLQMPKGGGMQSMDPNAKMQLSPAMQRRLAVFGGM